MSFSGQESDDAAGALDRGSPVRHNSPLLILICLSGLLITGLVAWGALRTERNTEQRLLETQSQQAATILSAAVEDTFEPMVTGLEAQAGLLVHRRREVFLTRFERHVGPSRAYVSASLWQGSRDNPQRIAALGASPAMGTQAARSFLTRALGTETSVVKPVAGKHQRIAYAAADRETGLVIYAEQAFAPGRWAPVDEDSKFKDLDFAIYLGRRTDDASLMTHDVARDSLPLTGTTYTTSVPFGDTTLTLVTRPSDHLGSDLSQRIPLFVLIAGVLLTALTAAVGNRMASARNRAEADTKTIRVLYEKVDALFGEQRELSIRLQRALLPQYIPDVPGLEVAAQYTAGAAGIDIGGDWYSIIGTGDETFAFVVGDVSGHGVDAVAEMAHARFTVRAYLMDGDPPHVALQKCSRQFDVVTDGHLVTVIAGIGNVRTGEITLANAGHPRPLVMHRDGTTDLVKTKLGPPLGVGLTAYEPTHTTLPPSSTLLCYTDGLIERRGEDITAGLERLCRTAAGIAPEQKLEQSLRELLDGMRHADAADDIAILAMRRASA